MHTSVSWCVALSISLHFLHFMFRFCCASLSSNSSFSSLSSLSSFISLSSSSFRPTLSSIQIFRTFTTRSSLPSHGTGSHKSKLKHEIETILNHQIQIEGNACHHYLEIASWSERNGLPGIASFFYLQSHEERTHMIKLIQFINTRGGNALIPSFQSLNIKYKDVHQVFQQFQLDEQTSTDHINEILHLCTEKKDYITQQFMHWFGSQLFPNVTLFRYTAEQIQEEYLMKDIFDRLSFIGDDWRGIYVIDRDVGNLKSNRGKTENADASLLSKE
jgi:ferritin